MTKEKAIKGITSLVEVRRKYVGMQTMKDEIECLDMAIKALEQQPCEDAISRQAVLDEMYKRQKDGDAVTAGFIKKLPPVTPKPKTGHWIEVTNGRGGHECDLCHEYAPSYKDGDEWLTKYCHSCGARMEGDKE